MLRACVAPLRERVRYASLFPHNVVLASLFDAPPGKVALTVEPPGGAPGADFTYGALRRDVLRVADLLVARREAVGRARGEPSLAWLQPRRPDDVRGLFAQGARTPSCACVADTGVYGAALLASPTYAFVVALLASWALNQLATPLSDRLTPRELVDALDHSGARTIFAELDRLAPRLPPAHAALCVRGAREVDRACAAGGPGLGRLETIVDTPSVLSEAAREAGDGGPLTPELLEPVGGAGPGMRTAEDVVDRLARETAAARAREQRRLEDLLRAQHRERYAPPDVEGADDPLCFDSERLEGLNAVFRRWFADPGSRPSEQDDCLMLYTSGTTARPKGAVHTHASLSNMVRVLQAAWAWEREDVALLVLPLAHVHGLVNVLLCALASGARCVMTAFDGPARLARRLAAGDLTLFMSVPALYTRLIAALRAEFSPIERTGFRKACEAGRLRLMVSGSAPLPAATLRQFRELAGHALLERYGMTEVGMALGQPLRPVGARVPGTVGSPFPAVRTLLLDPAADTRGEGGARAEVGLLAIASPSVFDRYWNNPEATRRALRVDADGVRYFETGDTVRVQYPPPGSEDTPPLFTIMGRTSVDIIKSNGHKLSALEIEAMMLLHSDVFYEVAVVGVKHEVKGEEVVAVVALQEEAAQARAIEYDSETNTYESDEVNKELKKIVSDVLAPYKLPRRFICVPKIPRNETGKVNKVALKLALNLQ